jgi:hypothetical protein
MPISGIEPAFDLSAFFGCLFVERKAAETFFEFGEFVSWEGVGSAEGETLEDSRVFVVGEVAAVVVFGAFGIGGGLRVSELVSVSLGSGAMGSTHVVHENALSAIGRGFSLGARSTSSA